VVRGPAALLAAVVWFLVVGSLPRIDGAAGAYVGGCIGAVAVALAALSPLAGRDEPVGLAAFGAGAAFLAAVLVSQDVGHQANPAEALFAAAAGLLFGWAFASPAAVLALPLVVAGIDLAAVLTGPVEQLRGTPADILSFELPRIGGGTAARIGLLDATFLAMFGGWSLRYALRPRLAIGLMVGGLCLAVVLSIALERAIPALPLVAAGFLVAGSGRLRTLLARDADG
jgi:hypothetical protein